MAPPAKTIAGLLMMILLLQEGDHIMLGVDADVRYRCNTASYSPDGAYARHVLYVKVNLWEETPAHQDDDYVYNNSSPTGGDEPAYGHAKCSTDLSPDDCRGCIGAGLGIMHDKCGFSVGAEAVLDNCELRYEAYPIQD